MNRHPVEAAVVHDRSAGFADLGSVADPERRDLHLIIKRDRPDPAPFSVQVQSLDPIFAPLEIWHARLALDRGTLWGAVHSCQTVWREDVVRHCPASSPVKLLQRRWDLAEHEESAQHCLRRVALAGDRLFRAIFTPAAGSGLEGERLEAIGAAVRRLCDTGSLLIRVSSDEFFAPWNMLYSRPLVDRVHAEDAAPEGFWGYQHVVEQSPLSFKVPIGVDAGDQLEVAACMDLTLSEELHALAHEPVLTLLERLDPDRVRVESRSNLKQLGEALARRPLADHVLYFCCHAQAEREQQLLTEAYLTLSDGEPITRERLLQLFGGNEFANHPIVLLNACETARMNSLFYDGFAWSLLEHKACAVVGTACEVPAVFAGEFARRFLGELLAADEDAPAASDRRPDRRVGRILLRLRRTFLDDHRNPLGMLYSLYHGADATLPLRPRTARS